MRDVLEVENGTFTYSNKYFTFEGSTVGGKPHGYGTLSLGDGSFVTGNFTKGDLSGQGSRRWSDGSTYWGEFLKGELHGQGRLLDASRATDFCGTFCFGTKTGQGRQVEMRTRRIYHGNFTASMYEGDGVMLEYPPNIPMPVSAIECVPEPANVLLSSTTSGQASAECPPLQVNTYRGLFHKGKMSSPDFSAIFANGDEYQGPAVNGEWCCEHPPEVEEEEEKVKVEPIVSPLQAKKKSNMKVVESSDDEEDDVEPLKPPLCRFFAAGSKTTYVGPMKDSLRVEVPQCVVLHDISHDSLGSMMPQFTDSIAASSHHHPLSLFGNECGFVTIHTSCLVTLRQVTTTTVMEKLVPVVDKKNKKKPVVKKPPAKKGGGGGGGGGGAQPIEEEEEPLVERTHYHWCQGESGRQVRATVYKLQTVWSEANRLNKRVPRDAIRALFATEPLTPRKDLDKINGNADAPTSSSAVPSDSQTPGTILSASPESGNPSAISDGTMSPNQRDQDSPSGSRAGKMIKTKSGRNSTHRMKDFNIDQGRPVLHVTMERGELNLKVAVLTRDTGDFLLKLEVLFGDGVQLRPGDTSSLQPVASAVETVLIPMRVVR